VSDDLRDPDRSTQESVPARALDERALVRVLLESGVLSAGAVHAGLKISGAARRHQTWTVRVADGGSVAVKQACTDGGRIALAREAMLYQQLSTPDSAICAALPRLISYDEDRHLLIVEFVDGQSLVETRDPDGRLAASPAAELGRTLTRLHMLAIDSLDREPPWILDIHCPDLSWYRRSSEASLHLRGLIQQSPVIGPAFEALRNTWTPQALVHGDLKLHHVIARRQIGPGRPSQIAVIDWETAQTSDPAWDIGSVIAGYLALWL
jgi:aminoglycoside phosphotransferase (APT) family kinase protein